MYDHYPDAETATSSAVPDSLDRADLPAPPVRAPAVCATDGERLMRFRVHRDEAAFREVVEAHAVLVWGVCWQVLRHREDVEDVFQATFLILARKCASIRASDSAAGWLYRVAFRTALAARTRRRRLGAEPLAVEPPATLEEQFASIERAEQVEALLEELHALGDRYRQPLVLCYLEGRSRQEAADELGVTMASVKGRLARGMRMLRTRLAGRGMALSTAAAVMASEMAAAQASVASAPVAQAAATATSFAWATLATKTAAAKATVVAERTITTTPGAVLLAKQGLLAMKYAAIVKPVMGLFAVGVTAGAIALASGDKPAGDAAEGGSTPIVELVDGEETSSGQLNVEGDVTIDGTWEAETNWTGGTPADDSARAAGQLSHIELRAQPGQEESQGRLTLATDNAGTITVNTLTVNPSDEMLSIQDGALAFQSNEVHVEDDQNHGSSGATLSLQSGVLKVNNDDETSINVNDDLAQVEADQNQPGVLRVRARDHLAHVNATTGFPLSGSVKVMKLERDHWQLKARGLQYKVDALKMKVNEMGGASGAALAEMEAEAHLATAEIKLCEARAQQLTEAIELAPVRYELNAPVPDNPGGAPASAATFTAVPAAPAGMAPPLMPPAAAMVPAPGSFSSLPAPPVGATINIGSGHPGSISAGVFAPTAVAPNAVSPIQIQVTASPDPAPVGAEGLWEFRVINASGETDDDVELRIAIPREAIAIDSNRIEAPAKVKARIENDVLIFTPSAKVRSGESLLYKVPVTPLRKGRVAIAPVVVSKRLPQGTALSLPFVAGEDDDEDENRATLTFSAAPAGRLSIATVDDAEAKIREELELLRQRNAELEGRLRRLEEQGSSIK
jgi:RNA polymerase sigma factor (sigma-70 family)